MPATEDDSSPVPFDGESPLTNEEKRRLRKILRDEDRMNWLRRKLKFFTPWVVSICTAAWAFSDWASKHIKLG